MEIQPPTKSHGESGLGCLYGQIDRGTGRLKCGRGVSHPEQRMGEGSESGMVALFDLGTAKKIEQLRIQVSGLRIRRTRRLKADIDGTMIVMEMCGEIALQAKISVQVANKRGFQPMVCTEVAL